MNGRKYRRGISLTSAEMDQLETEVRGWMDERKEEDEEKKERKKERMNGKKEWSTKERN